jgi:hypothetical protein
MVEKKEKLAGEQRDDIKNNEIGIRNLFLNEKQKPCEKSQTFPNSSQITTLKDS